MGLLACTITFSGELDPRFDKAFDGLTLTAFEGRSQLRGALADQSQLQGVLRQLFDLGLDVVAFTAEPAFIPWTTPESPRPSRNHPGEPLRG